ncbi:hypothetical protein LZ023_37855 (plasmid) [Pseudomonas silvicola]|nr:hypothetical protein LZ023_37855 [Pseudomonas silvicola]
MWREPQQKPDADHPVLAHSNQARDTSFTADFGDYSLSGKRDGREVCSLNSDDAASLGIQDGEIIELYNQRGHVLASARVTDTVMPGVVQLPTGAWYDPVDPTALRPLCRHGPECADAGYWPRL